MPTTQRTDMHAVQWSPEHARRHIRWLRWMSATCAAVAIVAIIGSMQADDARADDEARAWQRGYNAGLARAEAVVGDAYRVGVRDGAAARGSQVAGARP